MIDGLYLAKFSTPFGEGAGVVHKAGGQIGGGDSGYAYIGSLAENGNQLRAQLKIKRHNAAYDSVFGPVDAFDLALEGTANGNTATFTGTTPAAPGVKIAIHLTPLAA